MVDQRAPVYDEEAGPPAPPPGPPRRPLLWPWLLLLLLLVIGGLVAAWLLTRDHHNGASTNNVPGVVGLRQRVAVRRLHDRGLIARIHMRRGAAPPGIVLTQDPRAGADVLRHSVVRLAVAATQPATQVLVPDIVGQRRALAEAEVRRAGLVPKEFVVSSTQPKGTVVAQTPSAGKRAPSGSTVRLNVSGASSKAPPPPPPAGASKPATVTVPDVTGELQDAAQRKLNATGLKAGVVYVPSDQRQGTVVSESPRSGTTQKRGFRVQLNASLGPSPGVRRTVPSVVGLDPAAARSRLAAAGFRVQTLPQGARDRSQIGTVVDVQPSAGRRVPAGSRVTIYVGRAA